MATGLGPSTVNLNQADIAMLADVARGTYGVDGTGIRVGIISDSSNQLVHAVAPGVEFFFSAYPGYDQLDFTDGSGWGKLEQSEINFADRIRELAIDYGCHIIVDDVQPSGSFFQDGLIS
jgi:hypothetical protein